MTISKQERVLADARKVIANLVFNMTSHEGNPMTFPEVKTLIDGITVGGQKIEDAEQVLNIRSGWQELFSLVQSGKFTVSRSVIESLHNVYARNEALYWGAFRDARVSISGTDYLPPDYQLLDDLFDQMVERFEANIDQDDASYELFLTCAESQFFHDGNKRAGQYLMNGARLKNGLPIVTIPAKRNIEYNARMIEFYDSLIAGKRQTTEIKQFLSSCRLLHESEIKLKPAPTMGMS
jgi:Fic family protein